jgi:hypothetical protein
MKPAMVLRTLARKIAAIAMRQDDLLLPVAEEAAKNMNIFHPVFSIFRIL